MMVELKDENQKLYLELKEGKISSKIKTIAKHFNAFNNAAQDILEEALPLKTEMIEAAAPRSVKLDIQTVDSSPKSEKEKGKRIGIFNHHLF